MRKSTTMVTTTRIKMMKMRKRKKQGMKDHGKIQVVDHEYPKEQSAKAKKVSSATYVVVSDLPKVEKEVVLFLQTIHLPLPCLVVVVVVANTYKSFLLLNST